jgi:hypothetical protein
MRNKIAKKLKKYAFSATIANGWEKAKGADAVHMTNIRYFPLNSPREGDVQFCTRTREHKAPRQYYRRMKKLWAALTPADKAAVFAAGVNASLQNHLRGVAKAQAGGVQ